MLLFPLQPDILPCRKSSKGSGCPSTGTRLRRRAGIRIRSRNFQTLTGLQVIHVLLEFQNRSRTLESASIQFQHPGRPAFCIFLRSRTASSAGGSIIFGGRQGSDGRLVGFQTTDQIAYFLVTVFLEDIRSKVPAQTYSAIQPYGLSAGISERRARRSSRGTFTAPGIRPSAYSSAVRTSTSVTPLRSASRSSRQ